LKSLRAFFMWENSIGPISSSSPADQCL
jgi:hypothetical protein